MINSPKQGFLGILFLTLLLPCAQGCSGNQAATREEGSAESHSVSPVDTNWQITFHQHTGLSDVAIESFDGNSLAIVDHGINKTVSVDSIAELRLVKRSRFFDRVLTGAEIGGAVGAVFAILFVNPKSPFGIIEEKIFAAVFVGLETGIAGALIGAFVDLVSVQDRTLELLQVPSAQKPFLVGPFLENQGVFQVHSGH